MPPASSSAPAQSEEGAASPLHDGRLRYLYNLNSSGGGTLLCGDELLYQASPSESITLLYTPGAADPAGWQLSRNDGSGQRITEVYSAAGDLLWSGAGEWRAALAGAMLALEPGGFSGGCGAGQRDWLPPDRHGQRAGIRAARRGDRLHPHRERAGGADF